jgi:glutathione-regulated potassium-efflux system protein KefB
MQNCGGILKKSKIAVPIFKRIGLGSVLGYLIAGLIIGPFGFAFFQDSTYQGQKFRA